MTLSLEIWIEYLLRFSHLVAGIAWIGSSFYFIWLDSSFEALKTPRRNVEGELFMVHGGFYYQVEKRKIFPGELPEVLHWFKWEATLTWITGFALLVAIYYMKGASLLIDDSVLAMTQEKAIALSLGLAASFWFIYDFIWHRISSQKFNIVASLLLLALMIYINTKTFSGRGAFIQTGFMLGSMMLLNVWVRILPGQRKMISDAQSGKMPDYSFSTKAKTRSVHNTYFTFPVLFIMISNHYGALYNHPNNAILLLLLAVSGALTRHAMVTKNTKERWTLLPAAIGLMALVLMTAKTFELNQNQNQKPVSYQQVHSVFQNRCISCHSSKPTDDLFKTAPKGVAFDTEAEIRLKLPLIYQQVVINKIMPLGNKTQMTEDERALLATWINQQSQN